MADEKMNTALAEEDKANGQIKCPKCGATDIQTNTKTGKLRCNFCRHEFELIRAADDAAIETLKGSIVSGGAKDIDADAEDVITLKCESCGAEVVVDTASSTQARCHWCRNTLSINNVIDNGAVPDVLLPFSISKEEAQKEIEAFVGERRKFAHPKFSREFTTENICGVYLPYMLVDINGHMNLAGEGEIETNSYMVKDDDGEHREYDVDTYHVERDFDITIDDLPIESSSDKLDYKSKTKTTNIINSILPFDTENCVAYNANYLRGYTSEKRDTNITSLKDITDAQGADVARLAIVDTLMDYDRGVHWKQEDFTVKGDAWKAAYLPVWLYSYMQIKGKKQLLHYVAVNARTKETMGSVPINYGKLSLVSLLVEIASFFAAVVLRLILAMDFFDGTKIQEGRDIVWFLLVGGFIYFFSMVKKYRNQDARHTYEFETKSEVSNLDCVDEFLHSEHGVTTSRIAKENYMDLKGDDVKKIMKEKKKKK
ncbi:PDDEXK family nuclease [Aedoeadaptatus acetigenes]|uniref:TFIIB-type zinc ribbon-containing protein n=1 Tax=Aedoeadaptatus acetigenes TaxID=2981723 RepID=UPI0011DD87B6|nr:TFIIB-type zinc ribbon-containing protein [Aedoeadaptatus acetigenes]MCU6786144.1 TFIIB-type zinc ribbon-containing protein [Aedoeadaptatus acetigenes]